MNWQDEIYMFARDVVLCAIQKLLPSWLENLEFRDNYREGSPFTDTMRQGIEYILEKVFPKFITEIRELIDGNPMTMDLYLDIMEQKYIYALENKEEPYLQVGLCLSASAAAVIFLRYGHRAPYHLAATDVIAKFLIGLRHDGVLSDSMWTNFEATILEIIENIE